MLHVSISNLEQIMANEENRKQSAQPTTNFLANRSSDENSARSSATTNNQQTNAHDLLKYDLVKFLRYCDCKTL